jgi:hypothetical protein
MVFSGIDFFYTNIRCFARASKKHIGHLVAFKDAFQHLWE